MPEGPKMVNAQPRAKAVTLHNTNNSSDNNDTNLKNLVTTKATDGTTHRK